MPLVNSGDDKPLVAERVLGKPRIDEITHFIHRHFLPILIGAYLLAGLLPQFGTFLRNLTFAGIHWNDGSTIKITPSLIMLSLLLFNAGLGIKARELIHLWRRPIVLIAGFLTNICLPIALVFSLRGLLGLWHNSDELQNLLVGLAMIVAMPIAGSSTAWSQNANGNMSLSLGLVFLSTLLSPFTTPLVLNVFGSITTGDYSEDLQELARQGTNGFMCLTVVLPSLAGIAVHYLLGEKRLDAAKPYLKLANFLLLLLLNYSNATTALPDTIHNPDWDFLAFIYGTTIGLCVAAFASGWLIAKWLRTDLADRAALMFGLGMNNNGTGLVLATATLADHPSVLLPMIFYTLVQQIIAAIVDWKFFKSES
jgi:BASS family bile acid:Na+ symporter